MTISEIGRADVVGSRGVKAYTACCLADLLRLYAPDAPYSDVQLRVCGTSYAMADRN